MARQQLPRAGWTRGFAPGWEIRDYLRHAAAKHGALGHLRFGHEVLEAVWDERARRTFRSIKATLPHVIDRGGHIVVGASIYASFNGLLLSPYAVSKASV
jgi:NAD(P)-dependent dehydrogenase (short-subunit alcohol dehydrogenase family)